MTIGLGHYLSVGAILFTLGIFGIFLNRKNVIIILMSIELILLAVNINFVAFSTHLADIVGQVFALLPLLGAILAGVIAIVGARARFPGAEPSADHHASRSAHTAHEHAAG